MIDLATYRTIQTAFDDLRGTVVDLGADAPRHSVNIPYATYAPWLEDGDFQRVYATTDGHSLVDVYRCYELWDLTSQMAAVPGDVLEVGVWRGGTGALLAAAATRLPQPRLVHLCDTFAGVVKAGDADRHYRGGEHADTSELTVIGLLNRLELRNARLYKGVFPDDTAGRVGDGPFCLCHVDVDVHDSARDVLAWVWPRLSVGGAVVFDDYGFMTCQGVTRLVNTVVGAAGSLVLRNLNGHAVVVKTAT